MFKKPFSFKGRIRRTEYGLSLVLYTIILYIVSEGIEARGAAFAAGILYIPLIWFFLAQSAKRCHDRGNTGWFQIIPFYFFWMLFASGDEGNNRFGLNPKRGLAVGVDAEAL
ncbi:hypothetical protein GCM10023188_01160 [Pontibacter saemangeumensis]|uniref:DUF805 domain-containing protein n=1 Tax=Pontibacter saemangeumensis TaxID=1084525 RepID=A0ABP8L523_9BACT